MKKKYAVILLILVAVLLLSACRGDNSDGDLMNFESVTSATAPPPTAGAMTTTDNTHLYRWSATDHYGGILMGESAAASHTDPQEQRQRHIIQTGWAELETKYFDDVVRSLRQVTTSVNGYIESENLATHARQIFNITLRIPSAYFQDVMLQIEGLADIRHSRQSAEDVTDQFYDTASRLATRRIEENRLLALIEDAIEVRDILDLERRLSETRVQIEMYDAVLIRMANQIAYSTIYVTVFDIADQPIVPIAGPTLGDRVGGAFGDSINSITRGFQGFVVWLAGAIIPLVVWGGIIFVVYKVIRKIVKLRVRPSAE